MCEHEIKLSKDDNFIFCTKCGKLWMTKLDNFKCEVIKGLTSGADTSVYKTFIWTGDNRYHEVDSLQ